jgi:pilus assembly protein CpaF
MPSPSTGRFSSRPAAWDAKPPRPPAVVQAAEPQAHLELKVRLHEQLLDTMNLGAIDKMPSEEFVREVGEMVRDLLAKEQVPLNHREKTQLVDDILDELLGLGPLEPLLKDPSVSDILVNTYRQVMVERRGRLQMTGVRFKDDRHLLRIVNKIVAGVGRRVDESQPLVDARLPDGSRVNVVVPPIAVDGPLVSIRKFAGSPLSLALLVEGGALTSAMSTVLAAVVRGRLNLLISGGTGSGKTTLLTALSGMIDPGERIVTIEDAAELQMQQPHVVRMETRPPNIEGRGEVTQRDLVRNALRMRPDRIILGEVRSAEAFDMLQAMNTGHDGSMSTVHANTPRDALGRLEQMIGMVGIDMPSRSIRSQIASAIDVVIQVERMVDGKRRVVSVQEVTGMESDIITLQEIFVFRRRVTEADGRIQGEFMGSGIRPRFCADLAAKGQTLGDDLFPSGRLG